MASESFLEIQKAEGMVNVQEKQMMQSMKNLGLIGT